MEIKKYLKSALIFLLVGVVLSSCKKDDGDTAIAYRPIVVAYLVAGKAITLNVYEQKGLLDTSSYGPIINGLNITVSNGTKQVKLSQTATGSYTNIDSTLVVENATCSMSFDYNGKTISAETTVPSKPVNFTASSTEQAVPDPDPFSTSTSTFTPVTFSWSAKPNDFYLMIFKNQNSTPNRIGSGFGMRRGYQDMEEYLGQVSLYKTQQMTFQFAGYYDTYLYHINAEYNEILNSSSSSSLNLTNPATNIKNGLGIFTAMAFDKIILHVYEE